MSRLIANTVSQLDSSITQVIRNVDQNIKDIFERTALRKLNERLALAKTPEEKIFTTNIDGKVGSVANVRNANNYVVFLFTGATFTLILGDIVRAMEQAVDEATVRRTGKLSSNIFMFLGRKGQPLQRVGNPREIKNFNIGDVVLVGYTQNYSWFANWLVAGKSRRVKESKRAGRVAAGKSVGRKAPRGVGFLAMASKMAKSRASLSNRGGNVISVQGIMSKALESHLSGAKLTDKGVPAIMIRINRNIATGVRV